MTNACIPEIRVKVADLAATATGTLITIGLGSCVAIALYDEGAAVGGLAHVLLPEESMSRDRSNLAKFPSTAIPMLLERMERMGASRERIWAKIAGGASMFASLLPGGGISVGERNVAAVRNALTAAGTPILAQDTGGDYGRSVYFCVDEGRVEVRSLKKGARVL